MEVKNHLISVKTMTDYHLETFIRCPYKFYYQFILGKKNGELTWRQMVQFSVNNIVCDYYRLPVREQNKLNLLKLIDHYWEPIHIGLFENKIEYYLVLAKVTDHLLHFLSTEEIIHPPLFLYEKLHTSVEEISTTIALTFEVGEWTKNAFIIKKYLLDADESMVTLYSYLTVIFSHKAFGVLPEKIELLSLIDGKQHVLCPTEHDVAEGFKYLEFMKSHLQTPDRYFKSNSIKECVKCTFINQCGFDEGQKKGEGKSSVTPMIH